jgi:hypothetical protein
MPPPIATSKPVHSRGTAAAGRAARAPFSRFYGDASFADRNEATSRNGSAVAGAVHEK